MIPLSSVKHYAHMTEHFLYGRGVIGVERVQVQGNNDAWSGSRLSQHFVSQQCSEQPLQRPCLQLTRFFRHC